MADEIPREHPFARAILRGTEGGRIKRLNGFSRKRGHWEPDGVTDASRAFVQRAGSEKLAAEAENLFGELREGFNLKRRELICTEEIGRIRLETPAFTSVVWLDQDEEDPRSYRQGLDVGPFHQPDVVLEPAFLAIFRHRCDRVLWRFAQAVDLAERIDVIEDNDELAGLLEYPPGLDWLELSSREPPARLHMTPSEFTLSLPGGGDLKNLIEGAIKLIEELNGASGENFLPQGL